MDRLSRTATRQLGRADLAFRAVSEGGQPVDRFGKREADLDVRELAAPRVIPRIRRTDRRRSPACPRRSARRDIASSMRAPTSTVDIGRLTRTAAVGCTVRLTNARRSLGPAWPGLLLRSPSVSRSGRKIARRQSAHRTAPARPVDNEGAKRARHRERGREQQQSSKRQRLDPTASGAHRSRAANRRRRRQPARTRSAQRSTRPRRPPG